VKISEVTKILGAEVLFGENLLDQEITEFAASDLLSDILTFTKEGYFLLTGLTSPQVVRTAELTGAIAILFVRRKYPPQEALGLAKSHLIPILRTEKLMFESCKKIVEGLNKVKKDENQLF
jgi:predicted transcriptional regulator